MQRSLGAIWSPIPAAGVYPRCAGTREKKVSTGDPQGEAVSPIPLQAQCAIQLPGSILSNMGKWAILREGEGMGYIGDGTEGQ